MSNCNTCKFWRVQSKSRVFLLFDDYAIGTCQRHSPLLPLVITLQEEYMPKGKFPATSSMDTCGDYELRTKGFNEND